VLDAGHTGTVPAAITAVDLSRRFGTEWALDGLDLEVPAGEVLSLLGPNGAGKTTTVRLLNGVLAPDRGGSVVLGLDPAVEGDDVRRRTGVVTENAGLDERLTAEENLVLYARMRGMSHELASAKAATMLERFGMAHRASHTVQGFSTGQRKRVALARALLHDPEVLFLDEPTSGLDPEATRDVLDLIASLAREHGRTIVVCTHFLGEAGRLSDRMAVLREGRLLAAGRPDELGARLWRGLAVDLELAATADERLLEFLRIQPNVAAAEAIADGARVRVTDRDGIPAVVAALVAREVAVYGAVPRPPTLEDVYFALTADEAALEGVE
jgi:ABC-2 type transport system ATP-binding protein